MARAPRIAQDRGKNKSKEKNKNKGKEKEKEKGKEVRDGPVYDYEDGSVQDGVLKGDIMRAYERFKVCAPSEIPLQRHLDHLTV